MTKKGTQTEKEKKGVDLTSSAPMETSRSIKDTKSEECQTSQKDDKET